MNESQFQKLQKWLDEVSQCDKCRYEGLLHDGAYPVLHKNPPQDALVLCVLEATNSRDTFEMLRITCGPESDETGQFLGELLQSVDFSCEEVILTNSVLCLPVKKDDKYPVNAGQLRNCNYWLKRLIDDIEPELVIAFGGKALEALDMIAYHGLTLQESVGSNYPWYGRTLIPLYHAGRRARAKHPREQQIADIRSAFNLE
jgi:uracil-DNA glycosylase family 4